MSFLLFIGGAAALLLALNALYMTTPHYKNQVFGVQKMLGGVPRDLDVLSTGSNHAMYTVDWSLTPARGFSVATGPQSLRWDARLYHKYWDFSNIPILNRTRATMRSASLVRCRATAAGSIS